MVTRPILRYHGGKWMLAPWIISHFPEHLVYTEAYGGAASTLLQKKRSYAEVYNDIDDEIVNLFKVCRHHPDELIRLLNLTPFARTEFKESYDLDCDPIELARRTIIRSFMGFGSGIASKRKTGFRANSNRSGSTPAKDWNNYPDALRLIIERFKGVIIENRDAIGVIKQHDAPKTLHYLDPPYKKETRFLGEATNIYKHEMEDVDHVMLLECCTQLQGMVVISGYENELYNDMLKGWKKSKKATFADGAKPRTEILYLSPNCYQQAQLF